MQSTQRFILFLFAQAKRFPLKEAVDRHLDVCRFCRVDVDIWSRLLNLPELGDEEEDYDDSIWEELL